MAASSLRPAHWSSRSRSRRSGRAGPCSRRSPRCARPQPQQRHGRHGRPGPRCQLVPSLLTGEDDPSLPIQAQDPRWAGQGTEHEGDAPVVAQVGGGLGAAAGQVKVGDGPFVEDGEGIGVALGEMLTWPASGRGLDGRAGRLAPGRGGRDVHPGVVVDASGLPCLLEGAEIGVVTIDGEADGGAHRSAVPAVGVPAPSPGVRTGPAPPAP
jgi:hypothetical protein